MKSIYEYQDYKSFLSATEQARRVAERGFRRRIAAHLGCQPGYISQVLNDSAHLSLEQAFAAAEFLGLGESERKYFLTLVERERSGSPQLRAHFERELTNLREAHLNIRERVGASRQLSESEQSRYYSSWHYLAVHMLSTLPDFATAGAIAQELKIPLHTVQDIILFLMSCGIVEENDGKIRAGVTQVHLGRDSILIKQHHTNWRLAAVQSLATAAASDVHYSTVSTLSKKDADDLRAAMIALIQSYVETVRPSKEEVMVGFNLDFYRLAG